VVGSEDVDDDVPLQEATTAAKSVIFIVGMILIKSI
jgi:hypothetical protein